MYDLIIVGGGVAGVTAAIYAARKEMKFIIISPEFGGEIASTTYVENWPGIQSISGKDLAKSYEEHMKSLGVEVVEDVVTEVRHDSHFHVKTYGGGYESKTLIWATGSKYRELGVPGEGELLGRGITYCSICDGPLYKNKTVAVIGGGNTAMTSAIYMANIAKKVYIIDRSEVSKGDPVLLNQLKSKDNVDIINSVEVKEIHGEKKVTSITLNNGQNLDVDGVIINVGYQPVTDPIKSIVELNKYGYLEVDWKGMTKLPGFFAAGDVVFNPYKQLVVSASDGARAALGAYDYLSSN